MNMGFVSMMEDIQEIKDQADSKNDSKNDN